MRCMWGRVIAAAALLLAAGCGEHGAGIAQPGDGTGSGNTAGQPAAGGFALPAPAVVQDAVRGVSGAVLKRDGADYLAGYCQHAAVEGSSLRFAPQGDSFTQLAYSAYSFNLLGYANTIQMVLDWDAPPPDYSKLWIGLANWDAARWDWFPGPSSGMPLELGSHSYLEYVDGATGAVLAAVVLQGSAPARLGRVSLGVELGPWPMAGHDPRHTCCSPHTGPETNALKWKYQTRVPDRNVQSAACGPDGTVYLLTDKGLYAINPDGSLRWFNHEDTAQAAPRNIAVDAAGTVYVESQCEIAAYTAEGQFKWRNVHRLSPEGNHMALGSDGTVYLITWNNSDSYLMAIDQYGDSKWSVGLWYASSYCSPVVGPDGTVYATAGRIHTAVNPDGSLKWRYFGEEYSCVPPVPGVDGRIYVVDVDGHVQILDAAGKLSSEFNVADPPLVERVYNTPVVGNDGALYIYTTTSSDNCLYCFEPDGALRWVAALETQASLDRHSPLLGPDGAVYLLSANGILSFNPDGSQAGQWLSQDVLPHLPVFGADGTLYVACGESNLLLALNQAGDTLWSFRPGCEVRQSPIIDRDGRVFISNGGGSVARSAVIALNPDGSLQWSNTQFVEPGGLALGANELLYVIDQQTAELTALDRKGSFNWSHECESMQNARFTSPVTMPDGSCALWNYHCYIINPDGSERWSYSPAQLIPQPLNIVGGLDGSIYTPGYAIKDGVERYQLDDVGRNQGVAIGADGTVYVSCNNHKLLAFDPQGHLLHMEGIRGLNVASPAIGPDGTVYVCSSGGYYACTALDRDLNLKWDFYTQLPITAAPAVDAAGTVYFGCDDHCLYAVNADGALKWKYETYAPVRSAPAIGADGTVYFGSDDGFLYAIGPGKG